MNEIVKIYNEEEVIVTGIYEDFPSTSSFCGLSFISTWDLYVNSQTWVQRARDKKIWDDNSFQLFVQIQQTVTMEEVSERIKKAKYDNLPDELKIYNAEIFLHPMKDWHLRSHWKNGEKEGGPIVYVWLFAIIGVFMLRIHRTNHRPVGGR